MQPDEELREEPSSPNNTWVPPVFEEIKVDATSGVHAPDTSDFDEF
jgi:hypothetical protein